MKDLGKQQALHKQWMLRLLSEIADSSDLAINIAFKGGTCALLLDHLDRFSVDLDFDLLIDGIDKKEKFRKDLHDIFRTLGLTLDQESKTQLQFFLKYPSRKGERNTLKLEIIDNPVASNKYENIYFSDIDRYLKVQSEETMFANKLVALIDRYEKHKSIAIRDVYDINHFFTKGLNYEKDVIVERRKTSVKKYLIKLLDFIDKKVTQKAIAEDLNYLLDNEQFQIARKMLKMEVMNNIKEEIKRLE